MSSPKKSSTKTKSPAPATKSAASKPAATRKAAAAATTVASAAPSPIAAVPPPKVAPAPKPAPAAVAVSPVKPPAKRRLTSITANIDVGFGNALYIRGEGPGLSWEKGRLMECVWSDSWMVMLEESARPCVFKFLINDVTWSTGPDYTAESGSSVTLTPQF